MKTRFTPFILIAVFLAAGCTEKVPEKVESEGMVFEEIQYESDVCEFSADKIETVRYGGRIEMDSGEQFNFMSVECLAGFYLDMNEKENVKVLKAVDFIHGAQLLPVDEMVFLHSKLRPSPNGMFLTAIDAADEKMINYIYDAYPGLLMDWDEVLELVRNEWDLTGMSASEF